MAEKKGLVEIIPQDNKYDYFNILPVRINKKTGAAKPAVPGLLSGAINSVYDAVTLPGDVYSGKREATPENTLNAAMSMMGVGSAIPRRANEMRALGGIKLPERSPDYSSVLAAHTDEPLQLFSTARGSTYAQYPDASTIRNRASGVSSPGSGSEGGLQPKSRRTVFMNDKDVTDIGGLHQNREFPGLLEPVPDKPGYMGIRMQEDYGPRKAGEFIPGTIRPYSTKPEVGAIPVEYFSSTPKGIHFGNKITHVQKHTPKKAAPEVTNLLYNERIGGPPLKFGSPDLPKYAVRNVFSDAELASIRETGRMLPAPAHRGKAAKGTKYFTATNEPKKQHLRVETKNMSEFEPVDARFVDIFNPSTGGYDPILKAKGGAITIDDGNPAKRRKLI